jgi:hypothetical protein
MTEIGLITWYIVQLVLWTGPFGVGAFLAGCFFAGYFLGRWVSNRGRGK